jgi:hypothetical protein
LQIVSCSERHYNLAKRSHRKVNDRSTALYSAYQRRATPATPCVHDEDKSRSPEGPNGPNGATNYDVFYQ